MFVTDLLKKLQNKDTLRAMDFINEIGHGQLRGPVTKNESKRFFELSSKLAGLSKQQEQAIATTSKILRLNGKSQHWPSLDPDLVACQLMIRILDPVKFAQEGFNLCGPAALASVLTRSRPDEMARFAYDLLSRGEGKINGTTLEPSKSIRLFDPGKSIRQCDWLIMATLRDKKMLKNENGQYGLAGASDMSAWLKNAGFETVCAVPTEKAVTGGTKLKWLLAKNWVNFHPRQPSFVKKNKKEVMKPEANLTLLKEFYRRDCLIFLITSVKRAKTGISATRMQKRTMDQLRDSDYPEDMLQQAATQQIQMAAQKAKIEKEKGTGSTGADSPDHWVLIEWIDINFKKKEVDIMCFTFGTTVTIGPFTFDDFFKDYGGFVAANSRKVDAVEKKVN